MSGLEKDFISKLSSLTALIESLGEGGGHTHKSLKNRVTLFHSEFSIFYQWNSTFFTFALIVEGATEKVFQFVMTLKTIYNKNFGFIEQKCIFENYRMVKCKKKYDII